VSSSTIPKLVILKWRVRLAELGHANPLLRSRVPRHVQLSLARQVYLATIRCLTEAIQQISPFGSSEYRRYLALAPVDLMSHPNGCNMHLLTLVMLRRWHETYFSTLTEDIDRMTFELKLEEYDAEMDVGSRVRIYWRLRFLADFGALYWLLVSLGSNIYDTRRTTVIRSFLRATTLDPQSRDGQTAYGSAACPAVEGLDLYALAGRKSG
jgi:hypothetical protein